MKWIVRIVALLGALVVLSAAGLWVWGRTEGANRLEASIVVNRPAEAVWPFLYEEARLKQWVQWLESAQPSAEPTVGARGVWRVRDMNNGGAVMEIVSHVTGAERARRLSVRLEASGGFSGEGLYTLTPAGAGGQSTRVATSQAYTFDHWFARLMTPVVIRFASAKAREDLARLKLAAEKN